MVAHIHTSYRLTYAAGPADAHLLDVRPPDVGVRLLVRLPRLPQHPPALDVGRPLLVQEVEHGLEHEAVGQHDLMLQAGVAVLVLDNIQ